MKILVTGASGFIGRNLLTALTMRGEGNSVFAVVRSVPKETIPNVQWIKADLCSEGWINCLPNEYFDTVIHLAQSKHYREFPGQFNDIFKINVQATAELAEWAFRNRVNRFIFASTGNVYGFQEIDHREEDPCEPATMYGASKLSAEILLKPFSEFMDIIILRLFGVYGPGQIGAMLPGIIQQFNDNKEIILAGKVGVRFNPIFVDDCSEVIYKLTKETSNTRFEVLNVSGWEIVDLWQVSMLLEKFSGKSARIKITTDEPKQLVGLNEKLNRLCLLENQRTSFHDGFRRTYEWFKNYSKVM
jgi:UDP-glucose 4-epimerase